MRPWLAALLVAGCGSPAPLFIARSWAAELETLLIVTDLDDVPLSARPFRARPGEPLSVALEVPDEFRVYAAVFEPTVDFDACPAIFGDAGAPLVPASRWKSGVVRADETISLQADDRERFVLSAEGCEVECPSFTTRDVELPTMVHPSDAALFDASSALIVMGEENRMIQIDASLVAELLPPIAGATITSAYRAGDGMHWLGASDGRRFVGTFFPAPSFIELPGGESASPIQKIVVASDDLTEAFSLAEGGEVERWDGSAWTLVGQLDGTFRIGGLAWLGPGEAIAVSQEDRRVMRYRDGETTYETPSERGYGSAAWIPGVGAVIGGVQGEIYVDRGEGFAAIGAPFAGQVHAIAPFEDGFFAGGAEGSGATHRDATGFCMEQFTSSAIRYLIPIGDEVLMVRNNEYDAPAGTPTYATWVRFGP